MTVHTEAVKAVHARQIVDRDALAGKTIERAVETDQFIFLFTDGTWAALYATNGWDGCAAELGLCDSPLEYYELYAAKLITPDEYGAERAAIDADSIKRAAESKRREIEQAFAESPGIVREILGLKEGQP